MKEFSELITNIKDQNNVFLQDLRESINELDALLFNRGVTKFIKFSDKVDIIHISWHIHLTCIRKTLKGY